MVLKLAEIVEPINSRRYFHTKQNSHLNGIKGPNCDLFTSLADMTPDGVVIQCNGEIVYANSSLAEMLDFDDAEELLGHSFMEFIEPYQQCMAEQRTIGVLEDGLKLPFTDYILTGRSGKTICVEVSSKPMRWNGQLAMQSLVRDLTTKKFKDNIFKTLMDAVEQIPDSVMITNPEGIIEYVNPYFEKKLGYESEKVCDQEFSAVSRHILSREALREMVQQIRLGRVWRGELQIRSMAGTVYWKQASVSPVMDDRDEISYVICIMKDITALKDTEERLQNALKRANEASQIKSNFLANMSHEFRTPLNAIIGFNSLLTKYGETLDAEKIAEYSSYALEGGEHLLSLVNDLLDLARVEEGKVELIEETVSVGNLIDSVERTVRAKARENKCKLLNSVSENILVFADKRRLMQVLINLTYNAIKFSPKGTVEIKSDFDPETREFSISVADDGIGMSEESIEVALSPFGQADNDGYTRKTEGAGLGLPIAKNLVELHSGRMELESKLGIGTEVRICLPASRMVSYSELI